MARASIKHRTARWWLLRVAFGIPGLIASAIVGQYAIQIATDKGLYVGAGQKWDTAVTSVLAVLTSPLATHLAALMLGIAAGLLLDLKVFKVAEPEPEAKPIAETAAELKVRYPHTAIFPLIDAGMTRENNYRKTQFESSIIDIPALFDGEFVRERLQFKNCVLVGPATLLLIGGQLHGGGMLTYNSNEEALIEIDDERAKHAIVSAYGFDHCMFLDCKFFRAAFIGTKAQLDPMRQELNKG